MSLVITMFTCKNKQSCITVANGVLPLQLLHHLSKSVKCNQTTPHNVTIMDHKFISIFLVLHITEEQVFVNFRFRQYHELEYVGVLQIPTSAGVQVYTAKDWQYPKPFILQLQDEFRYRTGQIIFYHFKYDGFNRNMQHSHIYTMIHNETTENGPQEFPKGMSSFY